MFEINNKSKSSMTKYEIENVFHSGELLTETLVRVMHKLLCKNVPDDKID